MSTYATATRIATTYGVQETNPLADDGMAYIAQVHESRPVTLREVGEHGGRITRVRILAEAWGGILRCDVSYIYCVFPNGVPAPVRCDFAGSIGGDLWGKQGLKARFIEWAKAEGVSAKALGLLDEGNWSILK